MYILLALLIGCDTISCIDITIICKSFGHVLLIYVVLISIRYSLGEPAAFEKVTEVSNQEDVACIKSNHSLAYQPEVSKLHPPNQTMLTSAVATLIFAPTTIVLGSGDPMNHVPDPFESLKKLKSFYVDDEITADETYHGMSKLWDRDIELECKHIGQVLDWSGQFSKSKDIHWFKTRSHEECLQYVEDVIVWKRDKRFELVLHRTDKSTYRFYIWEEFGEIKMKLIKQLSDDELRSEFKSQSESQESRVKSQEQRGEWNKEKIQLNWKEWRKDEEMDKLEGMGLAGAIKYEKEKLEKKYKDMCKKFDATHAVQEQARLQQKNKELEAKLIDLSKKFDTSQEQNEKMNTQLKELQQTLQKRDKKEQEKSQLIQSLEMERGSWLQNNGEKRVELDQLKTEKDGLEKRLRKEEKSGAEYRIQSEKNLDKVKQSHVQEIARMKSQKQLLQANVDKSSAGLAKCEAKCNDLNKKYAQRQSEIDGLKVKHASLTEEHSDSQKQRQGLQASLESAQKTVQELLRQIDTLSAKLAQTERDSKKEKEALESNLSAMSERHQGEISELGRQRSLQQSNHNEERETFEAEKREMVQELKESGRREERLQIEKADTEKQLSQTLLQLKNGKEESKRQGEEFARQIVTLREHVSQTMRDSKKEKEDQESKHNSERETFKAAMDQMAQRLEESRTREQNLEGEKADTEKQRQTLEDENARVQTELDVSKREEERLASKLDEVEERNTDQDRKLSAQRQEFIDLEQEHRRKMEENDHWIMMAAYIGGAVLAVVGYTIFVLSRRTYNEMSDDFKWQLNEQRKEMKQPHPPVPEYPSAHANRLGVHEHPAVRDVFGMKKPWEVTAGEGFHVSRVTGGQKTTRGTTKQSTELVDQVANPEVSQVPEPSKNGKDEPQRLSVVIGLPPPYPEAGIRSEITEVPAVSENDGKNVIPCEHAERLRVNKHQWPAVRDVLGMKKSYDVTDEEGFQVGRITRTDSVQGTKLDTVPGVPQNEGSNGNEAEDDRHVQMADLMENLDI